MRDTRAIPTGATTMTDTPYHEHIQQPAFMIIIDDLCDEICGSKAEAMSKARDLRRIGFDEVKVKGFATWKEAHNYEDMLRKKS